MVSKKTESSDQLSLELRRGVIVVAILSQLENPLYGYSLRERLATRGLEVKEGTLYPLLRRLETQGLLESDWEVGEGRRPRRYYRLSDSGRKVLTTMSAEWDELVGTMGRLLGGIEGDEDGSH